MPLAVIVEVLPHQLCAAGPESVVGMTIAMSHEFGDRLQFEKLAECHESRSSLRSIL